MAFLKSKDGFTLVEMIVALAILGVFGILLNPLADSFISETSLNARAREIMHELQRTQHEAIVRREGFRFLVDIVARRYKLRPQNPLLGSIKTVDLTSPIVAVTSNFAMAGDNWRGITFSSSGIPSQTGEVVIFDARGRGRAIIVAVATGRIRIEARNR